MAGVLAVHPDAAQAQLRAGTMSWYQLTAAWTQFARATPVRASKASKWPSAGL